MGISFIHFNLSNIKLINLSLANITKLDVDIEKPSITSTRIDVDPASNKIRVKESRDL